MDGKDTNFGQVISLLNENIAQLQGQVTAISKAKVEVEDNINSLTKVLMSLLEHEDMTSQLKDHLKQLLEANGCLD